MPNNSLSEFAQAIPYNFKGFTEANPIMVEAAEAVNQGFNSLLYESAQVNVDNIPVSTAIMMGFGAHSAWITSYILTVSGYSDSGLANLRKAIEFVCYTSKVFGSEKRAKAWFAQRTDENARRVFSNECAIPLCYNTEKYKSLQPLLVAYGFSSSYGSHANFESMVRKCHSFKEKELVFSFIADKEHITISTGYCILIGYIMLKNLRITLMPCLKDKAVIESIMQFVSKSVRKARLSSVYNEYNGRIPEFVIEAIINEKNNEVEKMFTEMIAVEKRKKRDST